MPSKTLKKKYGKYIKKKVKLTKKQKLIGGNENIIEENIIRSILSRSILDYNVNTGKLLKKYLNNKTKNPHFKRKLKFINKFFLDDGKFTEIPDLIEDIKMFEKIESAEIIDINYINKINNFLNNHDEYINEYDGYSDLKKIIDKYINFPKTYILPTDKVKIDNYLQELKKSIDENKFTYNIKKFAKNMKYKVNSDIKNVDESLAEMLFYFNKKFKPNKTECSEKNLTECKIPKHTEELKIQSKIPI